MSRTEEERTTSGFRGALAHRDFRYLLASIAVSGVGDFMYSVAFVVWVLRETDSATWVSIGVILRLVPPAVLGSFGGVIADRFDRRRLMVGLDLGMAACMAALGALALSGGRGAVAIGIALTAISATLGTPRRPAEASLTPRIVGEDDLAAANALQGTVAQVMWFAGPAIGAAILAFSGEPAWAFLANAATFVVSAGLVARMRAVTVADVTGDAADTAGNSPDHTAARPGVVEQWREGIRTVHSTPGGLAVIGLVAAVMLAYGFEVVLHAFVATEKLGLGESGLGFMTMWIGAGGLVTAVLSGRMARSRRPGLLLVVSGACLGVSLAGLALTTSRPVAYALLVLEGIGNVIFEVLSITLIQRMFEGDKLGRVFGLSDSLSTSAMLAGSVAAPLLVSTVSLEAALVTGGGVLFAFSLLAWPRLAEIGAASVAAMDDVAPVVARLERLGIFAGASQATLERIARASRPEHVADGTVVLREGDAADDLFVVVSGDLTVFASGRVINRMTSGDWFGEIGLVERRPRTATVTAVGEVDLLRIDGQVFLRAIEDFAVLPEPLRRGITTRLARSNLAALAVRAQSKSRPQPGGQRLNKS